VTVSDQYNPAVIKILKEFSIATDGQTQLPYWIFARTDGMILSAVQTRGSARFGVDINKDGGIVERGFLTNEDALVWIKNRCREYLGREDVTFAAQENVSMANFIAGLLLFPIQAIVRGLVIRQLWFWFVSSQLHAPQLSIAGAIGISALISMMTTNPLGAEAPSVKDLPIYGRLLLSIFFNLLGLGLGWIIHLWM